MSLKKCGVCKEQKDIGCFYVRRRRDRIERQSWCIECTKKNVASRKPSKEKLRERDLIRLYGITLQDYVYAADELDNKCSACNKQCALVVDHCHKTNEVRGLLCAECNLALGLVYDSVYILEGLIKYLRKL